MLRAYISLEKLRLSDSTELKIEMEEIPSQLQIAPLLLLPLLENAFKHGTRSNLSGFLHLQLFVQDRILHFHLENSIIDKQRKLTTQVGLSNTRRRLELQYPERHTLEIQTTPSTYSLKLSIEL